MKLSQLALSNGLAGRLMLGIMWQVGHPLGTLGDLFRKDLGDFKRRLADAGATAKKGTALFLVANPVKPAGRRFTTGTHHQKFWVADAAGKHPFGFVGGLNLEQHEWDTSEHKPGDKRRTSPGINRQGIELQEALKNPLKAVFVRSEVEKALNEKYQLSQRINQLALS